MRVLERKGLLLKRADRQGSRPQRFVYQLTAKGKARFQKLLTESLLDFKRPQFSLDLSLYFLQALAPSVAKRRLRARMRLLDKLVANLKEMRAALNPSQVDVLGRILEHDLKMVETESQFLASLIATLP